MSQYSQWWSQWVVATFLGVVLGSCDRPPKAYPDRTVYRYQCEGGKTFDVTVAPNKNAAVVKFDDQEWMLKRVYSASGANFVDGGKVLWMRSDQGEERAMIEKDSEVLFRKCNAVSSPR